ncbi:hypothetical protein [Persicobacter psychrovividus]|uniref:Uncharacterized protein n=1 Tax=Persicobacter psychrovividus TaxID=387638 RepID=A0ABN6LDB9_9BACT|nr:hypothetical protein PEPS_33220 [Persicobacter psychrovividus]
MNIHDIILKAEEQLYFEGFKKVGAFKECDYKMYLAHYIINEIERYDDKDHLRIWTNSRIKDNGKDPLDIVIADIKQDRIIAVINVKTWFKELDWIERIYHLCKDGDPSIQRYFISYHSPDHKLRVQTFKESMQMKYPQLHFLPRAFKEDIFYNHQVAEFYRKKFSTK